MSSFVEALIKQRLWHWLETEREMTVEGEVAVDNGRIDLVAESSDSQFIGIEIKRGPLAKTDETYQQLNKYIQTGYFDKLYFASKNIDSAQQAIQGEQPIDRHMLSHVSNQLQAGVSSGRYSMSTLQGRISSELPTELLDYQLSDNWITVREYLSNRINPTGEETTDPISIEEGLDKLKRAQCPTEIGIIHVPMHIEQEDFVPKMKNIEAMVDPKNRYPPQIVHEAETLERHNEPVFNRIGEPWVRHCIWSEYGGIPEGYLPNVRQSDQPYRPVDLLIFNGSYDPTVVLNRNGELELIVVEAKGEASLDSNRTPQQLRELIKTESMTRMYLAVPKSFSDKAEELIQTTPAISDRVGLFVVDKQGNVEIDIDATQLEMKHDGYLQKRTKGKIGYGNIRIKGGKEVSNPYITKEEKERRINSDPISYANKILNDRSAQADENGWLQYKEPAEIKPPESAYEKINNTSRAASSDTIRSYLTWGKSAEPNGRVGEGYVRLRIEELDTNDDDVSLKLHFGGGSTEGGYIWFTGSQVAALHDILKSMKTISGGSVFGQGKIINLSTYTYDHDENQKHKLSGKHGEEELLEFQIKSLSKEYRRVGFQLGDESNQGVDVTISKHQWLDLVASIDILIDGNHRKLPGKEDSPRVGPDGEDTWSLGSSVENAVTPEPPSELNE